MAGTSELDSCEFKKNECSFVWDENSQLYFHASSGFYHDPNAGWYYSSGDGHYYKFENGNYVSLEPEKGDESEAYQYIRNVPHEPILDEPSHTECISSHEPDIPPPPSEWLEDTLIDLYLSGYSIRSINDSDDVTMHLEKDDGDNFNMTADGNDTNGLEGEYISEEHVTESNGSVLDEGASRDEENWRAQYGQVIKSEGEMVLDIPVVDLWDWAMVTEDKKGGNTQVARLAGRLVRRSAKLHPFMSSGGLLKTAPICEVNLDLVRVTSGQVYRLRSPSAKYLASLSTYDSSNPTKDWGFPGLSMDGQVLPSSKSKTMPMKPDQLFISEKQKNLIYRDRAAERRTLHGGFGVGPGQKRGDIGSPSSPVAECTEEAAAEALDMSFGAGSYARKILKNMGWKEGEALGNTTKGLKEPLQAVGNKGNAGLGWAQGRTKHC